MEDKIMSKYTVFSSKYGSLHFETKEEYEDFNRAERQLMTLYHNLLKAKYGIFATNQNRYVPDETHLNDLDIYPHALDK